MLVLQQFDEVNASWFGGGRSQRRGRGQQSINHGIDGPRPGLELSLKIDLDLGRVERIETDFDGLIEQMGRSLVETLVQQERTIAAHQSVHTMKEQAAQIGGGRELADLFDITLPTRQRSASERAMLGAMIDAFDPDPQAIV